MMSPIAAASSPSHPSPAATGKTPPPSQYPNVATGTAVALTRAATGLPDLSDVMVPSGDKPVAVHIADRGMLNQLFVTDYGRAVPVVHLDKRCMVLVPKVDANGTRSPPCSCRM
jgi:hypothetical protein